jgi:hypothetical protein
MDDRELLWNHLSLNVELHKHYLKLVLEFNALYYAITGGMVSYYFAHTRRPLMTYALVLPFTMSVSFAALFVYGAVLSRVTRTDVYQIRDALKLASAPEVRVLTGLLYISAFLMMAVAGALAVIFCRK